MFLPPPPPSARALVPCVPYVLSSLHGIVTWCQVTQADQSRGVLNKMLAFLYGFRIKQGQGHMNKGAPHARNYCPRASYVCFFPKASHGCHVLGAMLARVRLYVCVYVKNALRTGINHNNLSSGPKHEELTSFGGGALRVRDSDSSWPPCT